MFLLGFVLQPLSLCSLQSIRAKRNQDKEKEVKTLLKVNTIYAFLSFSSGTIGNHKGCLNSQICNVVLSTHFLSTDLKKQLEEKENELKLVFQ